MNGTMISARPRIFKVTILKGFALEVWVSIYVCSTDAARFKNGLCILASFFFQKAEQSLYSSIRTLNICKKSHAVT